MLDMGVLAEEIAAIVREQIEGASAALVAENVELRKRLEAIESAKPVEAMLAEAIAALPAPQDGKSVTLNDVQPLIDDAVAAAVAQLPAPTNGKDADPDAIVEAVAAAVAALPVPQDGKSVTVADVQPAIDDAVARAVAALPKAKDGIGLAGALIDRSGVLKMTLSDGAMVDLGRVDGEDGEPGLGFDDMQVVYDGERSFALEFARGNQVKSYTFALPMMIDRGVYRAGQAYQKG
ncbi:MAG: hypothetical protein Q8761_02505, partial [Sweet potato little leaf phytoplasma]|nr:hypothetical protein [Sweet potato little leaf phytoplasma]